MIKTVVKNVYWSLKHKKFKSVGSNTCMSVNSEIIGENNISIGDNFSAGKNLKLQVWSQYNGQKLKNKPLMVIGNNVSLMSNCQISCANEIIVNDGVLMGDNVFITDNFHGSNSWNELDVAPLERQLEIGDRVYIGKNVWIGRNVCIMPGVKICDGAVIGANSVVTHDIPEKCIAVGAPAKVIREVREEG
jgi:acetyltransferase-like isoleucine patch superfamily enzyme